MKGCNEVASDTLRENKITFRIATIPIRMNSGVDSDISYTLREIMSCEVYGHPFDSLKTQISHNHYRFSEQNSLINSYSIETMNIVTNWREKNRELLTEMTTSVIAKLPSDEESEDSIIFEVPTGKTVRVHLPAFFSDLKSSWDEFKKQPEQILYETYAADIAIIFFNENDEIEKVWWSGWIE